MSRIQAGSIGAHMARSVQCSGQSWPANGSCDDGCASTVVIINGRFLMINGGVYNATHCRFQIVVDGTGCGRWPRTVIVQAAADRSLGYQNARSLRRRGVIPEGDRGVP